jgi:serine/threonine protein kinase
MNDGALSTSGPSMPFVPGVIVDGKYRLERPLAEGGMGFVVFARHVLLDQPIALKFMHAWLAQTVPKGAARFLDEARAAACLQSDHVVRVSDTGTFQGSPYMVMEYLEGEDLEALLRRQRVLPVPLAVRYALQASEGLGEAHAVGIIHRDLKPANLFLARRSDASVRVKLLDFGISKMVGGANGPSPSPELAESADVAEMSTAICGSPLYMAPEQMLSSSTTDPRTDVWALGVVLYEMLAGVRPFLGDTIAEICARVFDPRPTPLRTLRPEVPAVLESAVMQCLQRDPDHRFQNMSAFAHALANAGAGETRATAARIDRIVYGRSFRLGQEDPLSTVTPMPQGSLTKTSFSRAVDGLADLMHIGAREVRVPETTPLPVAAEVIDRELVPVGFFAVATRIAKSGPRMSLIVVIAGLAVAALFFMTHATPSQSLAQGHEATVGASPASKPREASAPSGSPAEANELPLGASASSVSSATATHVHAGGELSPPAAVAIPLASDATPGRAPVAKNRAAPIGTVGFGGRE